jgi:hypothetical protein
MNKIIVWLKRNRTPIGYTVGMFCFVNGILETIHSNYILGAFQFMLGVVILLDVWDTKTD